MTSRKRRLACIGTALAAAATFTTLATTAASATSDTARAGIAVQADSTGAPTALVASLEGRNEVTGGAPQGQALELLGLHDNTLTYTVAWRGIGTPVEADIHAGARGVDGPAVLSLFTTPRPAGGLATGTVPVTPTLLAAFACRPG